MKLIEIVADIICNTLSDPGVLERALICSIRNCQKVLEGGMENAVCRAAVNWKWTVVYTINCVTGKRAVLRQQIRVNL